LLTKIALSAAPEPKRRFIPSKNEAKQIMKLVRAIREGRILPYKPPEEREREELEKEEEFYDLWQNEEPQPPNPMHIPAPKLPPPGYDLSYNPPPEYLPYVVSLYPFELAVSLTFFPGQKRRGKNGRRWILRIERKIISRPSMIPSGKSPHGATSSRRGSSDAWCVTQSRIQLAKNMMTLTAGRIGSLSCASCAEK